MYVYMHISENITEKNAWEKIIPSKSPCLLLKKACSKIVICKLVKKTIISIFFSNPCLCFVLFVFPGIWAALRCYMYLHMETQGYNTRKTKPEDQVAFSAINPFSHFPLMSFFFV